jgi:septum formation protein
MANPANPKPLVLASGSRYRAELLVRLRLPFEAVTTGVDEARLPGEAPEALAERLARMKASSLRPRFPDRLIIGSDQVASLGSKALGKPGGRARAIEQLALCSGRSVSFYTAVALAGPPPLPIASTVDVTRVRFRRLGVEEIERYVDAETPFDCAGSFKCEGLGITLFEAIESSDPTALIGLPLIKLRQLLANSGLALP